MTRPRYLLGLIFWTSLMVFGACTNSGTDTGNPIVSLKIIGNREAPTEKSLTSFSTSGVEITEARIVLKEINIEPLAGCLIEEGPGPEPPEMEFEFAGPFVEDLLNNTSLPDLGGIALPAGSYCELELLFDKLEADTLPAGISPDDPIIGNALLIQGHRQDGTPFIARLREDDRFKLEGTHPTGFEINSFLSEFLVAFDFSEWFGGVDLGPAVVSDDGVVHLDSENNVELWLTLIGNVKTSAHLFRDLDGDGVLDPEENQADLVLGEGVDEED